MTDAFILHHYDRSPYAEKVRLMFGVTNSEWQSLLSPPWPPRPNVDPLAGGYRRIPVAQCGADIFCDSAVIAEEVAQRTACQALSPYGLNDADQSLVSLAEGEAFFSAIVAVPKLRALTTMLMAFGPFGVSRFMKDRASLLKGGKVSRVTPERAKEVLSELFSAMASRLQHQDWLSGDAPSIVDLSVYHPLWLHANVSRRALVAPSVVTAWFARVAEIGQGHRREISQGEAFAAARDAEPVVVPTSIDEVPVALGTTVNVAPEDYGLVPVSGELAAVTDTRIIVARDTPQFGRLHVHFPRKNYSITPR